MEIISLVGFQGSGKSSVAKILQDRFDFEPISFADGIKDCLAILFGWSRVLLEGNTPESRVWREQVDQWWSNKLGISDFSPRYAMRNFGTEIMRQHFHSEIWVYNLEHRLMKLQDKSVVLVDCRFPNELALGQKFNAKNFRIKRGPDPWWINLAITANQGNEGAEEQMRDIIHESEWRWLGSPVDRVIENNGDLIHLEKTVWTTLNGLSMI